MRDINETITVSSYELNNKKYLMIAFSADELSQKESYNIGVALADLRKADRLPFDYSVTLITNPDTGEYTNISFLHLDDGASKDYK